jgi:HAD superfamily hydrolase (TIGR01549 family)
MPPMVTAIVFDMDGTLVDSSVLLPRVYIETVEAAGGPRLSDEAVVAAYRVGPPAAMLTYLLGRPATEQDVDDYHARLRAAAAEFAAYQGIAEVLDALRGRVRLAVFTGASLDACRLLLDSSKLLPYFEVLVGGDEVSRPKPYPDGIHLACERLGVAAEEAAYVGDAPNDLEAARRSGALAVAAAWGHQYRSGERADHVLSRPGDLLGLLGSVRSERMQPGRISEHP